MIINPNDIFRQIGLAVDPQSSRTNLNKSNYKTKPNYVICLEIQLSQNEKHIMEVKDSDDPRLKSQQFCQKHRLNKLAINLVEAKIREAKQFQEQKLGKSRNKKTSTVNTKKQQTNLAKSQIKKNDKSNRQSPQKTKKSPQKKISAYDSKSKSKSKSIQKSKSKSKMTKTGSTDNIYLRSVVRSRLLQEQKDKKKVQNEKKQEQKLTFKPKINNVSSKIVQFLRSNNIPKEKKCSPPKKLYDEMIQCTFKPKINKVSERIVNNKTVLRQQRENHKNLFDDESQSIQKSKKLIPQQQFSFHPQINPKSAQKITVPFFKRLQIAQQRKNKALNQQNFYDDDQCSFHPKIGRGPFKDRNKQNLKVWEYLYYGSKKQTPNITPIQTNTNNQPLSFKQSTTSQLYYQNLIEERINQVFQVLDNNKDGLISPNQIAIELLPTQCLQFLKPIFMEMDEIDATLNFYQFKKAVRSLMSDSDPGTKGLFISSKWKKELEERHTYQPTIDKKSRQLSINRSVQNLYRQGLKQKKNKEYRLQRQRALRQEKQLAECSFKPVLNHSSKVYIKKIAGKKTESHPKNVSDLVNSYLQQSEDKQ